MANIDAPRAGGGGYIDLLSQRRLIGAIRSAVTPRTPVQLIGAPASGKSELLARLAAEWETDGVGVLRVRGVRGLRRHPLAALMLATAGGDPAHLRARARMPATVTGIAAQLRSELRAGPRVVLVDDVEELDGTSAGVLESVWTEYPTALVMTRTPMPHDMIDPATERLAANGISLSIPPLDVDDLEHLLRTVLGSPIDPSTAARIRSLSGGMVGLALAIVTSASREGLLRLTGTAWTSGSELWSPALSAQATRHLNPLPEAERRALELVSLTIPCTLDTAAALASPAELGSLAARGLLRSVTAGGVEYVAVSPALIAEHFRYAAGALRGGLLLGRHHRDDETPIPPDLTRGCDDNDGELFQLIRDRVRALRRAAHSAWSRHPDPAGALAYLAAIEADHTAGDVARDVFNRTAASGDAIDGVALHIARVRWSAMGDRQSAAASDLTAPELDSIDGAAEMVAAARGALDATFGSVPVHISPPARTSGRPPPRARAAVTDAEVLTLVSQARFDEAAAAFHRSDDDAEAHRLISPTSRALRGLILLGQGRSSDASAWLDTGLRSSRDALDADGLRVFVLVKMFTHLLDGELQVAHRCAAVVHGVGEPSLLMRGQRQAFLNMSGVLAARRGDRDLAQRYADRLAEMLPPDGPLPAQSSAWLEAQLAASAGDTAGAATMMWDAAEALWQRRARFSAALGMLGAVETALDENLLVVASDRILPLGSPMLEAQLAYVAALVERNADGLVAAVSGLLRTGRRSLALESLRGAIQLMRIEGDAAGVAACRNQLDEIARSFGDRTPDTVRFNAARLSLSERELEVARLAATGMPNNEIAHRLRVSVRTVESHVYRSMRKLGLGSRQELRDYLAAEVSPG